MPYIGVAQIKPGKFGTNLREDSDMRESAPLDPLDTAVYSHQSCFLNLGWRR